MAALLGLLAFGLVLTGCSASTPLCNQATTLLTQGRPADAMALYARAGDNDEGNCAGNGLTAAGKQIGQAAQQEAKGADAEITGDVAGATAAYQAALGLNSGDARAAAGLVRLGQQAGTPPPAEIPALPASAEPVPWYRTGWVLIVGGLLLAVALAAAGYALFRSDTLRRRLATVERSAPSPVAQTLAQPIADPVAVEQVQQRSAATAATAEALAARCAALEDALARLQAGGDRRDRLVEMLAGQLSGQLSAPQASGILREQLFRGPEPAADGEGSGLVDVELVGVAMADGSRRTVAQRTRWTPPDAGAVAGLVAQLGPDPVIVAGVLGTGTVSPAWARSTELWLLPEAAGLAADIGSADPAAGSLGTLVAGGAIRAGALEELTADTVRLFAADSPSTFLARLVTVSVGGAWTHASLASEAHDIASGIAAAALEAAAGLTGPVWAGATGRTPGPPAELDRLLGRTPAEPDRSAAPVAVQVVADPLDEPGGADTLLRTTFQIERITVDADGVLQALNRPAADAARALSENPTDGPAIEAFRNALRIGGPTVACDIVAVGDRRYGTEFGYRLGGARLDLARMLEDSAELTIAFGAQLAAVRSGDARRPFDAALSAAVGPEQLGAIVAALPGRGPALTAVPGSLGAVDTHYPAAPEAPQGPAADDPPEQPDGGARMYAALQKQRPEPAGSNSTGP